MNDKYLRKNEDFGFTDQLREYAIHPKLLESNDLWEAISGASEGIGNHIYGQISNFVQNIRDIDVCGLHELKSIAKSFDIENTLNYNMEYPIELERLMDLLSISRSHLLHKGAVLADTAIAQVYAEFAYAVSPFITADGDTVLFADDTQYVENTVDVWDEFVDYVDEVVGYIPDTNEFLNNLVTDVIREHLETNANEQDDDGYYTPNALTYQGFMDSIYTNPDTEYSPDNADEIINETTNVLRNICIKASYQRDNLKFVAEKHAMIGTTRSVEKIIAEYIQTSFTNAEDWRLAGVSGETSLAPYTTSVDTMSRSFDINVVEYYDTTEYMNISADSPWATGVVSADLELHTSGYIDVHGRLVSGGLRNYNITADIDDGYGTTVNVSAKIVGPVHYEYQTSAQAFDATYADSSGISGVPWTSGVTYLQLRGTDYDQFDGIQVDAITLDHRVLSGHITEVDIVDEQYREIEVYDATELCGKVVDGGSEAYWKGEGLANSMRMADAGMSSAAIDEYYKQVGVSGDTYEDKVDFHNTLYEMHNVSGMAENPELSGMHNRYMANGDAPPANIKNSIYPSIATQPFIWNLVKKAFNDFPDILETLLYTEQSTREQWLSQVSPDGLTIDSWLVFNQEHIGYQTKYEASLNQDNDGFYNHRIDRDGTFDMECLEAYINGENLDEYYEHLVPYNATTSDAIELSKRQLDVFGDDMLALSGNVIANYSYDQYDNHYTLYKDTDNLYETGVIWTRYRNHPLQFPMNYWNGGEIDSDPKNDKELAQVWMRGDGYENLVHLVNNAYTFDVAGGIMWVMGKYKKADGTYEDKLVIFRTELTYMPEWNDGGGRSVQAIAYGSHETYDILPEFDDVTKFVGTYHNDNQIVFVTYNEITDGSITLVFKTYDLSLRSFVTYTNMEVIPFIHADIKPLYFDGLTNRPNIQLNASEEYLHIAYECVNPDYASVYDRGYENNILTIDIDKIALDNSEGAFRVDVWDYMLHEGETNFIPLQFTIHMGDDGRWYIGYMIPGTGTNELDYGISTGLSVNKDVRDLNDHVWVNPRGDKEDKDIHFALDDLDKKITVTNSAHGLDGTYELNGSYNDAPYYIKVDDLELDLRDYRYLYYPSDDNMNPMRRYNYPAMDVSGHKRYIEMEEGMGELLILPWSPYKYYSRLRLWLDAGEEGAVTTDGDGTVSRWLDKGPSKNHLEQLDSERQPIFNENNIGIKPSVSFDGVDDVLYIESRLGFESNQDATYIGIFNVNTLADTERKKQRIWQLGDGSTGATILGTHEVNGECNFTIRTNNGRTTFDSTVGNSVPTMVAVTQSYGEMAKDKSMYVNGVLGSIIQDDTNDKYSTNVGELFQLGSGAYQDEYNQNPTQFDVSELMVIASDTWYDRINAEGYLAWSHDMVNELLPPYHKYYLSGEGIGFGENTNTEAIAQAVTETTVIDIQKGNHGDIEVNHLTELVTLNITDNHMTELDTSNLTKLVLMYVSENELMSIDISNNTALSTLHASRNNFTQIDVTNNPELVALNIGDNDLKEIDLSNVPKLMHIHAYNNERLDEIDVTECPEMYNLNVNGTNISSLDTSYCTKLVFLSAGYTNLTEVDLSNNPALESLSIPHTLVSSLDTSNNPALKSVSIHQTNLESFDGTMNPLLEHFDAGDVVSLTSLDLTENTELEFVVVQGTGLSEVNIPNSPKLSTLRVSDMENLSRIYVEASVLQSTSLFHCYSLVDLSLRNSPDFTDIEYVDDVYPTIEKLDVHNTALSENEFDITQCPNLTYIDVSSTNFKQLDITGKTGLTYLDFSNTDVTWTDINNVIQYAWENRVEYGDNNCVIKFTNMPIPSDDSIDKIEGIGMYAGDGLKDNGIIVEYINTTKVDVSHAGLTTLDVSNNPYLVTLYCHVNQLTELDVSNNTALNTLYCHVNQLTELDVSNNTALNSLHCTNNQLTELDVSNNTALNSLYCYDNQLTALDVSNNTALNTLRCPNNQLTELDVSNNTALKSLYCYDNQLTALDVSNNTALNTLHCSYNQLTELDVSNNTALNSLHCTNNQLTNDAYNKLVADIWNNRVELGSNACSIIISNGTVLSADNIAKIEGTGAYVGDGIKDHGSSVVY